MLPHGLHVFPTCYWCVCFSPLPLVCPFELISQLKFVVVSLLLPFASALFALCSCCAIFALLGVASPVSSSSCYLSACFLCGSCSFSYFFSYSLLLLQLWHLFNRLLCLVTLLPRRSALFNSLRTRRTLCCCCNYGTFLTDYSAWLPCCLAVQRYSILFVRVVLFAAVATMAPF